MGATYTRQSTYEDGDTITAAHTNDEFDQLLAAFQASTGHTHDGTANEGGPITKLLGNTLTFGAATSGTDITITFDGESNDGVLKWMEDEDYFEFSDDILIASTEKIQFRDTAIYINSSTDGQLDLVADTEIQIAATTVDINGAVDVSGNLSVGGNLDVTGTIDFSDSNISNVGSLALDTITNDGTDITLDSSGDIILDAGGANITFKDDGTSILDIANNSSDVELTVSVADKNFAIKGTDGASAITALDIDMALAGKATFNGDVVVGGDLTITGDDLVMGTNTSGHLLIADGTNFNPTAVGDLSEISTVANDDVFLAVDTSGGGLKKIQRSAIVAGLATSGAISNVVEDTSPQLGGDLDMNGNDIVTTSNATIDLAPNGTGTVVVRGNTNSGRIVFNCESNSHGQTLASQPHSAAVTNTMLLPAGSSSTLVSLVSTDTLTNKTLTSPVINTATVGTSIVPASADGATLGSASAEFSDLYLADGGTIFFGNDQEITLTHVADDGLILKHVGTGDGKEPSLSFHAGDNDIAADDVLGSIFFKAPDEGAGTDAILVAAGIEAVSEGDFSASNNATKLSFKTGASEAAAEKLALSSGGDLSLTTDSSVLKFGADADTTLTHTDGTGLTLNSTNKLTFGDTASFIQQSTDGTLRIDGEAIIDLNASTRVDVSGDLKVGGEVQTANIGFTDGDNAITIADGGGITAANGITSTAASNTFGATSFNDANITNVGSIALDSIASDAGTGTAITFGAGNVPNTNTNTSVSGSTAPDFSQYTNFIWTLTGNLVLTDPGDEVAGQSGIFVFIQDGTGSRTLSHAADQYFVAGGTSITLTTTASAIDIVPYFVQADGKIHLGAAQLAFAEA
jgi:cytoskeletal protein CcmA (bactofilin family)